MQHTYPLAQRGSRSRAYGSRVAHHAAGGEKRISTDPTQQTQGTVLVTLLGPPPQATAGQLWSHQGAASILCHLHWYPGKKMVLDLEAV